MIVTDGFTGNVALKVVEGVSEAMLEALRDVAGSSRRAKAGGLLLRPALLEFRDFIDPESAGRRLPARAAPARGRAARALLAPRHRAAPSSLAARASEDGLIDRTHAALAAAGALRRCRRGAIRGGLYGSRAMTREEVFTLIQAHLADELELDPARIEDATRFREDLEADSLDLYTLVQELEDSYGVKMSDEEAARIVTVGQAVDFVVAHAPARA